MKALGERGFPVPVAVDHSRHAVLMSMAPGVPLSQVMPKEANSVHEAVLMSMVPGVFFFLG